MRGVHGELRRDVAADDGRSARIGRQRLHDDALERPDRRRRRWSTAAAVCPGSPCSRAVVRREARTARARARRCPSVRRPTRRAAAARAPCSPACRCRCCARAAPRVTAMPKSVIRTAPVSSMSTFAGLRSRCRMPCRCAAASASHSCRAISATFSEGSRPTRWIRAARSSPCTSSIDREHLIAHFADIEHAANGRMGDPPRQPDFVEQKRAAGGRRRATPRLRADSP